MARVRFLDDATREIANQVWCYTYNGGALIWKDYGIDLETDNSQHQTRKTITAANKKKSTKAFVKSNYDASQ